MDVVTRLKNYVLSTKRKMTENSLDSLLWIVNIVPSLAGFSIRGDTIRVPFWILHLSLLFYGYGVGSFEYQFKHTENAGDFIKSYFNVSILVLDVSNSWWFLRERPLLKALLKDIDLSDRLARGSGTFNTKHERLMKIIKRIIMIFYGCNIGNAIFVYLPNRVSIVPHYYMTPCIGIESLTTSPNREVCLTILALQELSIMTVVLNFQALLLLLIGHTTAMYQILVSELMYLDENGEAVEVKALAKETLPSIIRRHALTLEAINKLKSLYSVPLGVNFGSNAVCISLFFYLPLQEWLQFMPILVYCFLVFFLYCFLCQRLINAAEEFERAVYCCGWENFDLREKKLLYVMLRQSQKPVQILAANIIPVNIYTFATTLQAMFKFVTVVKF